MKFIVLLLLVSVLVGFAACSSEPSTNANPRRTFNAQSGNFEGPSPLPSTNPNATNR
jgi:hypothetical protein